MQADKQLQRGAENAKSKWTCYSQRDINYEWEQTMADIEGTLDSCSVYLAKDRSHTYKASESCALL
jgi:hypothetical protein